MVWLGSRRQDVQGPHVQFECPKCHRSGTIGLSYDRRETLLLLHLVPLFTLKNTFVICGDCKAHLLAQLTIDELRQHQDSDVSPFLSFEISFVLKTLSVLSLLLCWFPVLGIVLASITLIATIKSPSIWRTLAIISLVASFISTFVLIVIPLMMGHRP